MNDSKIFDKSRLDILIYAQDGRGLGHVSRSAAIGMALRRIYPKLKVLLLTGFRDTQMLLGECPLDWMKLPSYQTLIVKGQARGKIGDMNLKNCYLGPARERFIRSIIWELRPRLILVDHLPLGRKDELSSSLILSLDTDTRWVLGMRSISGDDKKLWSQESSKTFQEHYDSLLWYGDKAILVNEYQERFERFFFNTSQGHRLCIAVHGNNPLAEGWHQGRVKCRISALDDERNPKSSEYDFRDIKKSRRSIWTLALFREYEGSLESGC